MPNDREHVQPNADRALDKLKYEVAEDLGLDDDIKERGWGDMTTRKVGKIGGNMVRRMVKYSEQHMTSSATGVTGTDAITNNAGNPGGSKARFQQPRRSRQR